MSATPLQRIPVGVVIERRKATSPWIDWLWRPLSVLPGEPDTPLWTQLSSDAERATFYAGAAEIELHRTDTTYYRDNIATGEPKLWVVLRPTNLEPPFDLVAVTADPGEGEGFTQAGTDLVEPVPMPQHIQDVIAAFVAEHHVERAFFKRKRDRADPESLAKRSQVDGEEP